MVVDALTMEEAWRPSDDEEGLGSGREASRAFFDV